MSSLHRGGAARAALVAPLLLAGCAGGAPLLHPAQALASGEVRAMGGLAGQTAIGGVADSLRDATNEAAQSNGVVPTDATYAEGALVAAAVAPGISPVVGARVGVGSRVEGGVVYTGRGVRVDMRKAFGSGSVAVSVGAGLDATFAGRTGEPLAGVSDENLYGFGANVPVVVGWESTGGLYYVWAGARGGYEHDTVQPRASETPSGQVLSADRFWVGGLAGVAVGFRHIHVALEMDAAYVNLSGSFQGTSAGVDGLVLSPGSAVWWDF